MVFDGDSLEDAEEEILRLKKECDYHSGKWLAYEIDYILPVFKLAEKLGIDLPLLVREAKGNCVIRLFEALEDRLKIAEDKIKLLETK